MRNRKRQKTIDDFSVSQLLDDFVNPELGPNGKPVQDVDDEKYIRMMLEKDKQRTLERTKRASRRRHTKKPSPHSETLDENIRQRYFPDMEEPPVKKKVLVPAMVEVQPDDAIVEEILGTLVVKDVSDLASKMKQAVDFVQEEMGMSESERRLAAALEDYKHRAQEECEAPDCSQYNDNILLLKRCQNCKSSIGEKRIDGAVWCKCINPERSPEVETDGPWVKSKLGLPCWSPLEE